MCVTSIFCRDVATAPRATGALGDVRDMSLGRVHSDATIDFYGENGVLFAQGRPFSFKGLSWYGAEGPQGVLAGLTSTSMDSVFGFMSDEGFNAVRVLFNHWGVRNDDAINEDNLNEDLNPELLVADGSSGLRSSLRLSSLIASSFLTPQ